MFYYSYFLDEVTETYYSKAHGFNTNSDYIIFLYRLWAY